MSQGTPSDPIGDSSRRREGMALAAAAACISGVAVFVNGYGVKQFADATAYTTAKNLVAALVLVGALALRSRVTGGLAIRDAASRHVWALAAIAVFGGSVPFVLFFEGLSRATSGDAAFIQKTLVVWVALLAVPLLHERLGPWPIAAIGLLVAGQLLLARDLTTLRPSAGELMVLAATMLWAVEVVIAKRVLAEVPSLVVATARMAGGVVVLVLWVAVRGGLGGLADQGPSGWAWAAATGILLAAYVATWYAALARAQAVDVTAMLVPAAIVTALLDLAARGAPLPAPAGLVLVAAGGVVLVVATWRRPDGVSEPVVA